VGCHTINKLGTMSLAAYVEELLSQRMQSSGEKPGVTPTNTERCFCFVFYISWPLFSQSGSGSCQAGLGSCQTGPRSYQAVNS
jgi:hypothetical protein